MAISKPSNVHVYFDDEGNVVNDVDEGKSISDLNVEAGTGDISMGASSSTDKTKQCLESTEASGNVTNNQNVDSDDDDDDDDEFLTAEEDAEAAGNEMADEVGQVMCNCGAVYLYFHIN